MKEITVTYEITLDGSTHKYTDTIIAFDIRDAHYQLMRHWYGVEKIKFISDEVRNGRQE